MQAHLAQNYTTLYNINCSSNFQKHSSMIWCNSQTLVILVYFPKKISFWPRAIRAKTMQPYSQDLIFLIEVAIWGAIVRTKQFWSIFCKNSFLGKQLAANLGQNYAALNLMISSKNLFEISQDDGVDQIDISDGSHCSSKIFFCDK